MKQPKYYVVWKGRKPGVYFTWAECKEQIDNFPNAYYKSFPSLMEAQLAFRGEKTHTQPKTESTGLPIPDAYCVDAACSGNPGVMEYRGVSLSTRQEIFHAGPFPEGTNNIGEFLAVVHALAMLTKKNIDKPIYSDSQNAIIWVQKKQCRTKLPLNNKNKELFELIHRAEKWLAENTYPNKILKWETDQWGEIPADFGRK